LYRFAKEPSWIDVFMKHMFEFGEWRIITEDLGMRKICAKMVPRLLNEKQKERRVQESRDILEQLETEPNLLKRVVTGDES